MNWSDSVLKVIQLCIENLEEEGLLGEEYLSMVKLSFVEFKEKFVQYMSPLDKERQLAAMYTLVNRTPFLQLMPCLHFAQLINDINEIYNKSVII